MISSKQRAKLRGMANTAETLFQIGKQGINDNLKKQTADALLSRELIKLRVLETADVTAREAAGILAEELGADVVQVIGTRFILYKPNPKHPVIRI
ncbi:MAG TPA: ribosome assembly RNA-binding protein YhbY [Ruminococcaceae bacterium]|nr:ribosome assembly RNA-binding protein YhbY [Oscillospiraceae bacterium]